MVKGESDMTVVHPAMRTLEPLQRERAIDLTAFIGQWPFRLSVRAEASDLSAMADRLQLSGVCVSHIASIFGFDTRSGNEALLRITGDMPVVLSGLRAREWDTIQSMLNADHATVRVLLDLWFTNGPIAAVAQLEARGSVSRLAYGSCVPIQVPEATALQLASANMSADSRTAMCRLNAASLLGLDSLSKSLGNG